MEMIQLALSTSHESDKLDGNWWIDFAATQ